MKQAQDLMQNRNIFVCNQAVDGDKTVGFMLSSYKPPEPISQSSQPSLPSDRETNYSISLLGLN